VVQHIVAKTEGVPLYVEELTKMLLASGLLREQADQYVLTGPLRAAPVTRGLSACRGRGQGSSAVGAALGGRVGSRRF
jgi:hypothetical protein